MCKEIVKTGHAKRRRYLVVLVLLVGAFLRVWGLDYGLPFILHQDEPIVVNHAAAYGTGDLNPHFFIIPPFCSYLLFLCYGAYFVIGKLIGLFSSVNDFAMTFFAAPGSFYLIARVVLGVIPGTLSIWLVYLLYKRLFLKEGAVYAAAIYAFSFLCVINSHYAYADNILLCFILWVYLALIKLMDNPALRNYLAAGVLLGLAAGTKYNAVLLALSCYIAHVAAVRIHGEVKRRFILDGRLWVAVLSAAAAFILVNPYSVLDHKAFLGTIMGGIRANPMGWTHHLSYSLAQGIGPALLIAGFLGGVMMFLKKEKLKALFFISFPAIFYVHLVYASQRYSRYVLPLVPFLAVAAAFLLFKVIFPGAKNRVQRAAAAALIVLLLITTTIKSVKSDLLFSGEDTRAVSAAWIEGNISSGARIAVDHTAFRPLIRRTKEQIKEKILVAGSQEGMKDEKEKKIEYLLKAADGKKTYNVFFLTNKKEKSGQFLSTVPALNFDIEELRENGIEYVVINYNSQSELRETFIRELEKESRIAVEFSPYYDGRIGHRYDPVDATFMAIDSRELFTRRMTGPVLVVYKLKDGK